VRCARVVRGVTSVISHRTRARGGIDILGLVLTLRMRFYDPGAFRRSLQGSSMGAGSVTQVYP